MRRLAGIGPEGWAAVFAVAAFFVIAVVAPELYGAGAAKMSVVHAGEGISAAHWLGTDNLGHDVFLRVLVGTRLSLGLAVLATLIAFAVAMPLGAALAVAGGRVAKIGARVNDAALSFPSILLAIIVTSVIGPSPQGAVTAIGIAGIPSITRLTYTLSAAAVARDYVQSARILGVRPLRILWRHVLPNIGDTLSVAAATRLGISIVEIASLSFLGLGVNPPQYDWGQMLVQGADSIYVTPAAALGPAAAIALAGIAFGFSGEAIARLLNPRRRSGRRQRVGADVSAVPATEALPSGTLLDIAGLQVFVGREEDARLAVRGIDLSLAEGEIVGLVGESGSGKSLTALAVARVMQHPLHARFQHFRLKGQDLESLGPRAVDRLLANNVAMVFQDPSASLNPALRIAVQMTEAVRAHAGMGSAAARTLAVEHMRAVRLGAPARLLSHYPHELSGGMRQRIMIAMGLMNLPSLIIADEPTTALDVTVQAQVLDVLRTINRSEGTAILLISHDIAVVAQICQRILVMYAGSIIESGPASELLHAPAHPYTRDLLQSLPDLRTDRDVPLGAIPGRSPSIDALPPGCAFHPRCSLRIARCSAERPPLASVRAGRQSACWRSAELMGEASETKMPSQSHA